MNLNRQQFKAWYELIKMEVVDNDCYAFRDWQPVDSDNVCIVDVGANVGAFSIMASKRFPNSEVHAFELVRENYEFASEQLNAYANVTIQNTAMVGSNKPVGVFLHQANPGGHKPIFDNSTETYLNSDTFTEAAGPIWQKSEVDSISFNDFMIENNIDKIDFLKLDCEGSEYEILFHIDEHNLWNKISRISMELHGRGDLPRVNKLMEMLKANYSKVLIQNTNMVHCEN